MGQNGLISVVVIVIVLVLVFYYYNRSCRWGDRCVNGRCCTGMHDCEFPKYNKCVVPPHPPPSPPHPPPPLPPHHDPHHDPHPPHHYDPHPSMPHRYPVTLSTVRIF